MQVIRQHVGSVITVHPAGGYVIRHLNREWIFVPANRHLKPINKVCDHDAVLVDPVVDINSLYSTLVICFIFVLIVLHADEAESQALGFELLLRGGDHAPGDHLTRVEAILPIQNNF